MAEKTAKKPGFSKRFGGIRGEIKKIVWPTPKQTWNNLVIVIVFVILATLLIIALDASFGWLLTKLLEWVGKIATGTAASGSGSSSVISSVAAAILNI